MKPRGPILLHLSYIAYNLKDSANHEKARTPLLQDEFFKLVFSPSPNGFLQHRKKIK